MNWDSMRLSTLTLPAKLLITMFLFLVGAGYLFGTANIYLKHQDADLEPGLTPDDIRRHFHGMEKTITPDATVTVRSTMLTQVSPEGDMREFLEAGGEPAIRGLVTWLELGAKEEDFAEGGLIQPDDLSAQQAIANYCVECHHADGGDMEDVPFAPSEEALPEFSLVIAKAEPEFETNQSEPQTVELSPISINRLVHVTHPHILAIPVFTLIVGLLFLMTGAPDALKLVLGPLPMLFVITDIGSWWLARYVEPLIYLIAASGAVYGIAFALQILCILGSMWLGPKDVAKAT
jgi:hypothetical protein